jgi:hypothetical protein
METQQIISLGEVAPDVFAESQGPDAYEEHELINDSIRGPAGAVVRIHKNDLAILRANKLVADVEAAPVEVAEGTKPEKVRTRSASQSKAEAAAPVEPEPELAALPNIADLPGV